MFQPVDSGSNPGSRVVFCLEEAPHFSTETDKKTVALIIHLNTTRAFIMKFKKSFAE